MNEFSKETNHFFRKAQELLRLIEMKTLSLSSQTANVVLSLDLASNALGMPFCSLEEAVKLSSMPKAKYVSQKHTVEKLLNLKKPLSVTDICIKLELDDSIKQTALKLLQYYESQAQFNDANLNAQNLSMAVFQCCKWKKLKTNKMIPTLLAFCDLDKAKWKRLEELWNQWIEKEKPFDNLSKQCVEKENDGEVDLMSATLAEF